MKHLNLAEGLFPRTSKHLNSGQLKVVSILVAVLHLGTILHAGTLTVMNLADSGYGSLRATLASAASGDTIVFGVPGTIYINSRLVIDKGVQIVGRGVNQTIIDAQGICAICVVTNSAPVLISNLTMTNGHSTDIPPNLLVRIGGGIQNYGNLTLSNCVVAKCDADVGGGIFSVGQLTVRQCGVIENKGTLDGGGICVFATSSLVMENSSVIGNSNSDTGGGIFIGQGPAYLTNSTIAQNVMSRGAIGAGIAVTGTNVVINSCTIVSNQTGGGIWASHPFACKNSIVAGNYFFDRNLNRQSLDIIGPVNSLGYNLFQETNNAIITGITSNNLYGVDPQLGPLEEDGSANPSFPLLSSSPAVDQGSSSHLGTDQKGFIRIFDVPAIPNVDDGCDIGAREALSTWLTLDIGKVTLPGYAIASNGLIIVDGPGFDIWGYQDQFRFVYDPLSGDGEIVAKVLSVSNTAQWAKGGVMLRESLDDNARNVAMVLSPNSGVEFQYRDATGGLTTGTVIPNILPPYWVRVSRSGNTFSGFFSADGFTWTLAGSVEIGMGSNIFAGMAASSHNTAALTRVVFSNAGIRTPASFPLPPPWRNNDVGAVGIPGFSAFSSGRFIVAGDGADVWGKADAFQYAWMPWSGDGALIARVDLIQGFPHSQAGIMFRQSLDPKSINATVFGWQDGTAGVTYRNFPGQDISDGSTYIASPPVTTPFWLKMERKGRKFTGFISQDGLVWNQIAQPDMAMTDPILIGLIASSHDINGLSNVTFDNVTVIPAGSQTNDWTSPTTGNWHDLTWSLGVRPAANQSVEIINPGNKVVGINTVTGHRFPNSMTVSNLQVDGFEDQTNALVLDYVGTTVPFVVLDTCKVSEGGSLENLDSDLHLQGTNSRLLVAGGTVSQSGGFNTIDGTCFVGYGTNSGLYNLNYGISGINRLQIGDMAGGRGVFNQFGGIANVTNLLDIVASTFNLYAGVLTANTIAMEATPAFIANFHQRTGIVEAKKLVVDVGDYYQTNGNVVTGSTTLETRGRFYQFGGIHRTALLQVSKPGGGMSLYNLTNGILVSDRTVVVGSDGSIIQSGGENHSTQLSVGSLGALGFPAGYALHGGTLATSNTVVDGGGIRALFSQTSGVHSVVSTLRINGTDSTSGRSDYLMTGGSLASSNIVASKWGILTLVNGTASCVNLKLEGYSQRVAVSQQGGSVVCSNLLVNTLRTYDLSGGSLICTQLVLTSASRISPLGSAIFNHTGGTLKNSGRIVLFNADLNVDRVNEDLGSMVLLATSNDRFGSSNKCVQHFAASSQNAWTPGAVFQILNWQGALLGGGAHQVYFGNSAAGLSASQLGQVVFINPAGLPPGEYNAKILPTGEVVPNPQPVLGMLQTKGGMVLSWPEGFRLQTATNVAGPYWDMPRAGSPFTNGFDGDQRYFRLRDGVVK